MYQQLIKANVHSFICGSHLSSCKVQINTCTTLPPDGYPLPLGGYSLSPDGYILPRMEVVRVGLGGVVNSSTPNQEVLGSNATRPSDPHSFFFLLKSITSPLLIKMLKAFKKYNITIYSILPHLLY